MCWKNHSEISLVAYLYFLLILRYIADMMTLRGCFCRRVEMLRARGELVTAENYRSGWRSVSKFLGGEAAVFRLSSITEEWVREYVEWLDEHRNLKPGTIDYYFRCLRALYRYAVKKRVLSPAQDPFTGLCPSVPPTCKRTLSEEDLYKIVEFSQRGDIKKTWQQACDVFLFLFYARGMCFVDVYNLKWSNLYGNYINYHRSKTEAPLQVKIVPEIAGLLDKYTDSDSDYVFPFLRENRRREGEICEKSALRRLNRGLEQVRQALGITQTLTTYVARHTWASMVEACGMNTAIISQGLGHSSEQVTRTYMRGMPSRLIDNANEEMLNCTVRQEQNRKKKQEEPESQEKKKKNRKKCHSLFKKGTLHRIRLIQP